ELGHRILQVQRVWKETRCPDVQGAWWRAWNFRFPPRPLLRQFGSQDPVALVRPLRAERRCNLSLATRRSQAPFVLVVRICFFRSNQTRPDPDSIGAAAQRRRDLMARGNAACCEKEQIRKLFADLRQQVSEGPPQSGCVRQPR